MKRYQFIEYINYPERLNEQSLTELKRLVEEYPYFQAARMLLVKNLHLTDDIGFDNELKITAAHITDRKKLFFLINNVDFLSEDNEIEIKIIEKQDKQKSILQYDKFLDYERGNVHYDLKKEEMLPEKQEPQTNNEKMSLIDNFLQKQNVEKLNINNIEKNKDEDFSLKSLEETDDLMTETLADILIKQKNFSKAKKIFERLCLIYPEKNVYFAARIKELELM